jgi:predicted esterase
MVQKPPYVLEAIDPQAGKPATLIFLHGYGDDAEGLPLGKSTFQYPFSPQRADPETSSPNKRAC